jgi:hypothetical protein
VCVCVCADATNDVLAQVRSGDNIRIRTGLEKSNPSALSEWAHSVRDKTQLALHRGLRCLRHCHRPSVLCKERQSRPLNSRLQMPTIGAMILCSPPARQGWQTSTSASCPKLNTSFKELMRRVNRAAAGQWLCECWSVRTGRANDWRVTPPSNPIPAS